MPNPATNQQVQTYVDSRMRPSCTEIILWVLRRQADKATVDDIYNSLTPSPTWTDSNPNNSAHAAQPNDVLAWNTFIVNLLQIIAGPAPVVVDNDGGAAAALALVQNVQDQWAIIQKLPAVPPVP